jgi:photosystem II stability/assembly factor-like uncharacterized protein
MFSRLLARQRTRYGLLVLLAILLATGIVFYLSPHYLGKTQSQNSDSVCESRDADAASCEAASSETGNVQAEDKGEDEEAKPTDEPEAAARLRLLQNRNESGVIPQNALLEAAAHAEEVMKTRPTPGADTASGSAADLDRSQWKWLGPGNVGGRIRSLVIHPTNTQVMWIGSVSGGIWKTTDGGASWHPLNDFMANLAVSTLIIDPTDPNVLYAGTGEGFYNSDAIQGAGIFKTTDGGTTWSQLASTATPDFTYVNRLAISPADNKTLLAATRTGVWRSTDRGATWTRTLQPPTSVGLLQVAFHPSDGSKAVASGNSAKAYYSTDGGSNWTQATGLPSSTSFYDRIELAYARSSPNIVYASVGTGATNSGLIYKSTDGGQTYSRVGTNSYGYLGGQGWYDNAIWVDPKNANNLVVGGIDLWRSTDGGNTLTRISQWQSAPASSAHADQHAIVSSPSFDGTTNKTVFIGNDGGVYKVSNMDTVQQTTGWQELNNNLGITQFYGGAGNTSSGTVVGGTQDNGSLTGKGNTEGWTQMFGGDGGFSAADPTDSNYFYGEYVRLQIHRSSNGGASSSYIHNGIGDAGSKALFIAPFILDPNNANTMLAGGQSLWRSTNVKASPPSWSSIKGPIGSSDTDNISAIAVAPGNSNVVWVGYANGNVYKTTDGTASSPTWTRMDQNTPNLPDRYVTRLTVNSGNPNIVYATFGGYSADNVYKTTDGGLKWTDITGSGTTGLPVAPVRSLVINPNNPNWLYVGTEVGVFASEDGGATWSVPTDGPANVSVDELFWMGSNLVAATHGRGMFTADIQNVDKTPPKVVSTTPADKAKGVARGANITATFSEPMKESSVNTTTFKLQKKDGTTITATVTYAPATKTATLDPTKKLTKSGAYVATVTSGAQDQAGNALDQDPSLPGNQDKRWTFKVRR